MLISRASVRDVALEAALAAKIVSLSLAPSGLARPLHGIRSAGFRPARRPNALRDVDACQVAKAARPRLRRQRCGAPLRITARTICLAVA